MKALPRLLIVCLIALMSTACQQPTGPAADKPPTRVSQASLKQFLISPDDADRLRYRIDWMQDLNLEKGAGFKYLLAESDVLVLVESQNILTVIDALTGKVMMREQVATPVTKLFPPARQDQRVVINSESQAYIYDMNNGVLLKRLDLPSVASTGALLLGDLTVFGSPTGKVFAVQTYNGFTNWEYQMRGALLVSPVLVDGNTVVAADSTGVVKALSPRGRLLWARAAPPWKRISAQPQPGPSAVYIASEDQGLYGFDRTTGRMWRHLARYPLTQSPVVVGERVFQHVPESGLLCFDAITGRKLWESDTEAVPLMLRGDRLFARRGSVLMLLEESSGKPIESYKLPKVNRIVIDRTVAGNMYLCNDDGRIMKLSPKR